MRSLQLFLLLPAGTILLSATQTVAQQLCKPALTITEVRISEARNLQRTWTAVLDAEVSRCSTTSGQFQIEFTRLKESAPDLQFVEHFIWAPGRTKISLDIWWDEWVQQYRIGHITPCPCRN
jgi:hypothetical protein